MKEWILAIFLLLLPALGAAREYGHYDLSKILSTSTAGSPPGQASLQINLRLFDQVVFDLRAHAGLYPPQFDSPQDRRRAESDVSAVSQLFDPRRTPQFNESAPMLLRLGMLEGFGYNMDIPGMFERAVATFDQLLKIAPDDSQANLRYGMFLALTNARAKAVPYLEKAKALDVPEASFWLGFVYISVGDKDQAAENLRLYTARVPADTYAAKMLDAIEHGNIERKQVTPTTP
jgi:tetratricopeptide (TPR) repeat protein